MLAKLTLLVSHLCNLRCTYCYAGGGNYGSSRKNMSEKMAEKIFDHFSKYFNGIKEVFFFGGEPLMAIDTIERVCVHSEELFNDGHLSEMPMFSLVTNGTLFSEKFLQLAAMHNFEITVSIDGPPTIHDLHRKTISGGGSFSKVLEGIKSLKSIGLPFHVECTYTYDHWEKGYLPIDLYEYFKGLGANKIILTTEIPMKNNRLNRNEEFSDILFPESADFFVYTIKDTFANNRLHFAGLEKMFDSIINRPEILKDRFCGAGINNFAINPDGLAFPCHMLNGQMRFFLGNYQDIKGEKHILPKKSSFEACIKCQIKELCRNCPARMYLVNQSDIYPIPAECRISKMFVTLAAWALTKNNSSFNEVKNGEINR